MTQFIDQGLVEMNVVLDVVSIIIDGTRGYAEKSEDTWRIIHQVLYRCWEKHSAVVHSKCE